MKFYAQPYDICKDGFFFETHGEYLGLLQSSEAEEFDIQFIEGSREEADLFKAAKVTQGSIELFIDTVEGLCTHEIPALFFLMDCLGQSLNDAMDTVSDVTIFEGSEQDAAGQLVDDGCFGTIPKAIYLFIDLEAIARDMNCNGDFVPFTFGGTHYVCTNANSL